MTSPQVGLSREARFPAFSNIVSSMHGICLNHAGAANEDCGCRKIAASAAGRHMLEAVLSRSEIIATIGRKGTNVEEWRRYM